MPALNVAYKGASHPASNTAHINANLLALNVGYMTPPFLPLILRTEMPACLILLLSIWTPLYRASLSAYIDINLPLRKVAYRDASHPASYTTYTDVNLTGPLCCLYGRLTFCP
jgi:hypothetical protein